MFRDRDGNSQVTASGRCLLASLIETYYTPHSWLYLSSFWSYWIRWHFCAQYAYRYIIIELTLIPKFHLLFTRTNDTFFIFTSSNIYFIYSSVRLTFRNECFFFVIYPNLSSQKYCFDKTLNRNYFGKFPQVIFSHNQIFTRTNTVCLWLHKETRVAW